MFKNDRNIDATFESTLKISEQVNINANLLSICYLLGSEYICVAPAVRIFYQYLGHSANFLQIFGIGPLEPDSLSFHSQGHQVSSLQQKTSFNIVN
jgi:hypothetical protein